MLGGGDGLAGFGDQAGAGGDRDDAGRKRDFAALDKRLVAAVEPVDLDGHGEIVGAWFVGASFRGDRLLIADQAATEDAVGAVG